MYWIIKDDDDDGSKYSPGSLIPRQQTGAAKKIKMVKMIILSLQYSSASTHGDCHETGKKKELR